MTPRYHRARAYAHVAAKVVCALALGTARDEGVGAGMAALAAATMGGNAVLAAVDWHRAGRGDE